jgi:hypothetical protein
MRGGRAQEAARRRDLGRSHHVEVPAQAPWEPEYTHECLTAAVRWLDGSGDRLGRCQRERWHDDARLPRASSLSLAPGALSATSRARFAFGQTLLRCVSKTLHKIWLV